MARLRVLKNGSEISVVELNDQDDFIAGRSDSCQIILDHEGVSRQHFRIFLMDQGWTVEKLSKFGTLTHRDSDAGMFHLDPQDTFSVPPFTFEFEMYPAAAQDHDPTMEVPQNLAAVTQTATSEKSEPIEPDEVTNDLMSDTSTEASRALPYLTFSAHGNQEVLRLEGVSWTIGRDEDVEIQVDDPRSSRKHFKVFKDGLSYFVEDLGSSNGTYLNGERLKKFTPTKLESGDRLELGETLITFEVKDPLYDQQIRSLPQDLKVSAPASDVVYLPINLGVRGGAPALGAVRLEENPSANLKKKPNPAFRMALIVLILALIGGLLMQEEGKQESASKGDPKKEKKSKDPFDALTPQEQEFVKRSYQLGLSLFQQTKYEQALAEVRKIHEKVPNYLDSKEIETLCESAIQTIANKKYEEEIIRKQQEAVETAKKTVKQCQAKYANSKNVAAIETCLAPALEIDPENMTAKQLIEKARAMVAQAEVEKTQRAEYQRKVKAREAIFYKAKTLHQNGRWLEAVEAYERHIASTLPDPKDLEVESKAGVSAIKGDVEKVMQTSVSEAENHVANTEYREAILKLDRALELNPNHPKARAIYAVASKELFKKMKAIFSDSVVEESLGNIESAKAKWKKIVEQDVPKGEYRQKALIKLKKYGE